MSHINYKYDFTVEVFIVFKNKVLLRFHDKYNIWLSVGGHVELDEDPNEAAYREVKEEVGLDIELYDGNRPFNSENDTYKELIPPLFLNKDHIKGDHWHITSTYIAKTNSDKINPELESDNSEDWKWLAKEEVEDMDELGEKVRAYALKALDLLSS